MSGGKMANPRHARRRALRRYVLFQLPGLAALLLLLIILERWSDLPSWIVFVSLAAWIAKDVLLFPFVWRSYIPPSADDDRMVGEIGVCKERMDPSGYIFVRGELWKARLDDGSPVDKGQKVVVVGMQGLTLVVRPKKP
jgi:membrane protein implicated in regulation of membrane protease activity